MSRIEFSVATEDEFKFAEADRTAFTKPSLSPLEAYLGLKALFGEPNREFIDGTKQQWAFLIKVPGALLEASDWKLDSWSIHVYETNKDESRSQLLAAELEKQVAAAAKKQRTVVSAVQSTPSGHVIQNPFALYYHTAEELTKTAEWTEIKSNNGTSKDSSAPASQNTLCRAAFFQLIASVEGLFNLIYELYLVKGLRDSRIVDRLAREQIDIKVRLAPIYCDCFEGGPLDHTTLAFRNFHRLVNRRNDFIHANLTKSMKTPIFRYDGITFISDVAESQDTLGPNSVGEIELDEVTTIKAAIDELVAQVLSSMKPRDRKIFRTVMYDEFINVEYEGEIPQILV